MVLRLLRQEAEQTLMSYRDGMQRKRLILSQELNSNTLKKMLFT